MLLNNLKPKQKKVARKRRGQGSGSGNGTFGGRGCNGQNCRSGGGVRKGFEGGQTPLIQRMPLRRGFRNINRVEAQIVDIGVLDKHFKKGEVVDLDTLQKKGLVNKSKKVKILASGEITQGVKIVGEILVSEGARKAIEKAGGKVDVAEKVKKIPKKAKEVSKKEVAKEAPEPEKSAETKEDPKAE